MIDKLYVLFNRSKHIPYESIFALCYFKITLITITNFIGTNCFSREFFRVRRGEKDKEGKIPEQKEDKHK